MKPTLLFAAHHQRFKLNLIRRVHNALYELGLRVSIPLMIISVGGGHKGAAVPKLGRDPFHSGKFSERTIGNSGRKFTERLQLPLNLTSSYAHAYDVELYSYFLKLCNF